MITQLMNVIVGQTTKATRAGPEISESVAVNRNSGKGRGGGCFAVVEKTFCSCFLMKYSKIADERGALP